MTTQADSPMPADERLSAVLSENQTLTECLCRLAQLNLPSWYLAGGCVTQTVWNVLCGRPPDADILDYDLVYFDANDASDDDAVERMARQLVVELPVTLDVTNEARVHHWYPKRFGYDILPYSSTEDAIRSWPTTAASIGVRPHGNRLLAFAPFGLDDLFSLIVRPNRVQITPEIYEAKVSRWRERWPALRVQNWADGTGVPGSRRIS